MIIISHRGYWKCADEKNTEIAFSRSFELGFGTETDVRDCIGKLVISHDMPDGSEIKFEDFLSLVGSEDRLLAMNIKSDGLAICLKNAMKNYNPKNWFVFDMSIPDMRAHISVGNPVFARMSEVEMQIPWLDLVEGIWLDSFDDEWFDVGLIRDLIERGKRVCIVSSELHGRCYSTLWQNLLPLSGYDSLILCTDLPELARKFFKKK
ncbi:hypothetical protein N9P72_00075 [Amylibacter sp.]|nr:hypothetical protein [Amylibacter sp.]